MPPATPTPTPRAITLALPHCEPRSLPPSPLLAESHPASQLLAHSATPSPAHPAPVADTHREGEVAAEATNVSLVTAGPSLFATDTAALLSPPASPATSPSLSSSASEPVTATATEENSGSPVDVDVETRAEPSSAPTPTATTDLCQHEHTHPLETRQNTHSSPEDSKAKNEPELTVVHTNPPMSHSNASYSPLSTSAPPLPASTSSPPSESPTTPPTTTTTIPTSNLTKPLPSPTRPPPSSFAYTYAAFPFQAYPGNPDPGLSIPGFSSRRRASLDSYNGYAGGSEYRDDLRSGSLSDLRKPCAPFMAGAETASLSGTIPRSSSSQSLYKPAAGPIPRNPSTHSFRAPFLAPSSRPTSSLWSPPTYTPHHTTPHSPNPSTTALGVHTPTLAKSKPPLPSTLLREPIPLSAKPWLSHTPFHTTRTSISYWITLLLIILGAVLAAIQAYTGITSVNAPIPSKNLCVVMDEGFPQDGAASDVLDKANWNLDLGLNGFGSGEFEMTTADPGNVYVKNGQLYIMPTLTADKVQGVLDGGSFTLDGCTQGQYDDGVAGVDPGAGNKANGGEGGGANGTSCSVTSSDALGTVINPVQSARINTRGKKSMRFGKVEVRAKLPRGDWLFPQIFLLPAPPSPYGAWPVSGELDLLLARGNDPASYPAQANTFVRSSLSFGPLPAIASPSLFRTIFGFLGIKHPQGRDKGYTQGFHTYTMEWTEEFVRFSVDRPTRTVLEVNTRARKPQFGFGAKAVEERSYWNQAGFPLVAKGVGVGGGGTVNGNGTGNGNGNMTSAAGNGNGNGTDASGNNNGNGNGTDTNANATNANGNTNSTFQARRRSLHPLAFPIQPNNTHTNTSSSSSSPSPFPSSTTSSTNTNPDTITPITNPYTTIPGSTPAAPFDRPFYLTLSLAVGGTSGWFPDGVGGKMWFDASETAMRDFARAQETWYKTWPASDDDRALRIDYIKMWELC